MLSRHFAQPVHWAIQMLNDQTLSNNCNKVTQQTVLKLTTKFNCNFDYKFQHHTTFFLPQLNFPKTYKFIQISVRTYPQGQKGTDFLLLSVCLSICLSVCLPICLLICLSVCLSIVVTFRPRFHSDYSPPLQLPFQKSQPWYICFH